MDGSTFLDVLRLPPAEVDRILRNHVPQGPTSSLLRDRRSEERYTYRDLTRVLLEIQYPTRQVGRYRALSWNISAHGLGFLHGKFVYPGSGCRVMLRTVSGQIQIVEGVVCRCRHLEGRVHEAGMRFKDAIDLSQVILSFDDQRAGTPG